MIKKLQQCRETELNGASRPLTIEDITYAVAPLYKRGLIETEKRVVDNKILICVYVTEAGIEFLNNLGSI